MTDPLKPSSKKEGKKKKKAIILEIYQPVKSAGLQLRDCNLHLSGLDMKEIIASSKTTEKNPSPPVAFIRH